MFYTSCELIGSRLFHRWVDDNSKRKTEVIKEFPIQLFVKGKRVSDSTKGLMGEVLNSVDFTFISETQEFVKEYKDTQEIYGQTSIPHQFISSRYRGEIKFDFKNIKILIIDIETAFDNTGFPVPEKAAHEVLTIACKVLGSKEPFVVFGTKPYTKDDITFIRCKDEVDLLTRFQRYWKEVSPDIITGWNVETFDIAYLFTRCNNVMGEKFTRGFSVFGAQTERSIYKVDLGDKGFSYRILGCEVMDYLDLYKKYSYTTLENYRLDTVAEHVLNDKKVSYEEYGDLMGLYEKNYELYVQYNAHDVRLVDLFEEKLNYIFLAVTIAYIGKVRYSEIHSQVRFWDTYIYNSLRDMGIQIPPNKDRAREEIVGAFVKEPVPSLYKWVVTLDLTSLYPSIIMTFNLSPETLVKQAIHTIEDIDKYINMEVDCSFAKKDNVSVIANGATFDRSFQGILPKLVTHMFASRKEYKKHSIKAAQELQVLKENKASKKEIEEKISEEATFAAMQMAFKTALNSLYGATANPYFRYNNRSIAEGITMTGQLVIRFISNRLNVLLNTMFKTKDKDYVIFNDTDSAGLNLSFIVEKMFKDEQDKVKIVNFLDKFVITYINPFLEKEFASLTTYLNAYTNMLNMKREVIADRGLWRGKKHYILQMYDKEGIRYTNPKLKMMGIETAKSSTPKIVRASLQEAIKIILNKDEKTLQSFVIKFKNEFFNSPAEDISFPRGVSDIDKWVDSKGNLKNGTPIHVRGSIIYNQMIKKCKLTSQRPLIHNGNKVKFLYLKPQNPTRSKVIAFIDQLPPEFNLNDFIDRQLQFEKTFLFPLKSFTEIIGWNTEKVSSLESFFS